MDTAAHRRTRRFALLSAGAAGVIIAIAVYAALWTPGTLDLSSMPRTSRPPLVTWVAPNGPAWSAGIRPGATIMGDRPQRGASAGLVVRQGHSRITVGLERTRVELLDLLDAGVGLCVVLFGALVLMKGQDDRRAAVAFWRMSLPIGLAMGVIPAGFHGVLWAIALTFVALALFGPALLDLTLVFPSTDTPVLLRRLIWLPALVLLAFYIPCWRYPAPLFVLVSNASDGLLAAYILAACARLVWALRHPRSALQRTQLRFLTCGLVGAFLPLALFNLVPYLLAGRDLAPPQASILTLVVLLFSVGVAIVRTEFFGITSLLHRRPLRIVVGLVVLIGAAAAATGLATAGTQWWGWPASASAARASTLAVLGGLALWPWLVRRAERLLLHGGADPADTMLRVSAALAHAEVDTLGPLVVAHLGAVLDLDFALLLTPHAQSRHQHPRSFVPVTLIEAVERRGHELIVGPQASEIVGECVQDMAVLFLLIRDGPQEPIMFCCGPKRSGEHYTRQDKTLLRALGHYVAVLFHDQGLQAQLTEQSVRLRALEGSSEPLKPEELEVLPYVAQGFTSKEIGRALNVHKRTVEKRLTAIYRKWGVSGREDAVRIARQRGLLPVEGWEGWPARNTVEARAALPGDIGRKESNG